MRKTIKRLLSFGVILIMAVSFSACIGGNGNQDTEIGYGVKPDGFDDPMPQLWEHEWDEDIIRFGWPAKETGKYAVNIGYASEYTIGADVLAIHTVGWADSENLENIYVEESNPVFASEDGVLYSKRFEPLYRWPPKKPVTQPKSSVKYFAEMCYAGCDMPDDFQLPDGTVSIGLGAFISTNLAKLHIKENVKTVELGGFQATIKTIEISAPVVYTSFFYSPYVETVIFREDVRQIRSLRGVEPFSGLRRVEFPSTLEAIGAVPFPVNINVERYTIPKNVRYIAEFAFDDYSGFGEYSGSFEWKKVERNCVTKFVCHSAYARKRLVEFEGEYGNLIR